MAHNTRPLKRAQDGVAPQYYNPTTDEYEALHGTAGANHVVIYGPDGQPAALATEAKLEAARALLESLDGKDFASETTLAAMETELGLAKTELAAIKGMLTDGTAKGEVTLSGNVVNLWKSVSDWVTGATVDTPKVQDAAVKAELELLNAAMDQLNNKDFSTEAKLEAARALLESLDGKDFASETTLAALETKLGLVKAELEAVKTMLTDGTAKGEVTLSGNLVSGNIAELSSAQHSESATTVKTYTRAAGAARIEVYVESGRVRIRTDGQPCTAVTGEPLGEGFGAAWAAPSISVLFVSDAVITVVSR